MCEVLTCPALDTRSCHTYVYELLQERRNSIAIALELRLYYTNPSIWTLKTDSCDAATFFVTAGTGGCHKDNLQYRQI